MHYLHSLPAGHQAAAFPVPAKAHQGLNVLGDQRLFVHQKPPLWQWVFPIRSTQQV